MSATKSRVYPLETVVAEKLEAPPLDEVVNELAAINWPLLGKSNHY